MRICVWDIRFRIDDVAVPLTRSRRDVLDSLNRDARRLPRQRNENVRRRERQKPSETKKNLRSTESNGQNRFDSLNWFIQNIHNERARNACRCLDSKTMPKWPYDVYSLNDCSLIDSIHLMHNKSNCQFSPDACWQHVIETTITVMSFRCDGTT